MMKTLGSLCLGLGCLMILPGCPSRSNLEAQTKMEKAVSLGSSQIREFRGKKLTDFDKLRDNSIAGPQTVDTLSYRLAVDGLVDSALSLSYRQVLQFDRYSKLVTLYCVEGWNATGLFEGVLVADLLNRARVRPAAGFLIFHSADGYTTSLPLKTVLDRNMLLASRINNAVLNARNGFPFQLAAEDRLGYKWAKWVNRIEASSDSTYKGYWESRGYDNKADVK